MRVLICDDQAVVRDGLAIMLGLEEDIDIAGLAEDGAEALELARTSKPDLILMDLNMPIMNGIEATRRLTKELPDIPILVLTTYDADEWVFDALREGAKGYLLKDTPREELIAAIKGTIEGKSYIDPSVAGKVIQASTQSARQTMPSEFIHSLTERELEVLRLIAKGQSNKEIAKKLFLSDGTVRNYVSQILNKLDVADRTQAVILALRYGLDQ